MDKSICQKRSNGKRKNIPTISCYYIIVLITLLYFVRDSVGKHRPYLERWGSTLFITEMGIGGDK